MLIIPKRESGQTTIAAVAMHCSHEVNRNLQKYEGFIAEAAERGVQYLVFPEVSVQGYLLGGRALGTPEMREQIDYFRATAEPIPGPTTQRLHTLAKRHGMLIQAGMAERTMDGAVIYNSAVLIGPDGLIGVFRKFHNQFEWPIFNPGDHMPVFDTPIGRLGMFICYDLAFPEISRLFALQGATIAALTTAWPMQGDDWSTDYYGYTYDLFSRSTALANQIWLISSNQVMRPDTPGAANYYGHSRIVGPDGRIVADTGYAEGLAIATVDLDGAVEQARTRDFFGLNLIQDRRPAHYGLVADGDAPFRSSNRLPSVAVGATEQIMVPSLNITPESDPVPSRNGVPTAV
ncbi:MAG TPA: carbon-nitrogen hydrolase family protein [Thermomicrobiales bacterium]|jgi:predicted amidohydrolase|nr:carbon-nitrogen hydrolase family protein [Thermomicrobiales bacterium]